MTSSLDARKERKLESVLEREQNELQTVAKSLGKNVYSCEQGAQTAAEAFIHQYRGVLHRLQTSV